MTLIKPILVVCAIGILVWAFRNRSSVSMRAGLRVLFLALTAAAIASILDPQVTQAAADFVGVTRGTDLLLYVLVVVFAFTSVGFFLRFQALDRSLAEVIRASAIRDAVLLQGPPGGKSDE